MANLFADNDFNRAFLAALHVGTGTTYASWAKGGGVIPGRFRIDEFETSTGGITPGIGEIQTWFACDRRVVPLPLPELGDHLTIRDQVWEIVQRDEDDIGQLNFRLIKEELGLIFPEPDHDGDWDDKQSLWDQNVPGGPSRWDRTPPGVGDWDTNRTRWDEGGSRWDQSRAEPLRRPRGRPSREPEIAQAYQEAATAGIIGPDQPMTQVIDTVRSRIPGDRRGLGDQTMRRVIARSKNK